MTSRADTLVLFDVDGTLTPSRLKIAPEIEAFLLNDLKPKVTVGLVGGSDLAKIAEQMNGPDVVDKFDYVFSENGLVAHKNGKLIDRQSIAKFMGEEKTQKFINFCLGNWRFEILLQQNELKIFHRLHGQVGLTLQTR